MKAKFLILLLVLGTGLIFSTTSFGQTLDEDLVFGGSTDDDYVPLNLEPALIEGTLFSISKTVEIRFTEDLGNVEIQIVGEDGKTYIKNQVNTTSVSTVTIDLKSLPAKKYIIWCINRETGLVQQAAIQLRE